MRVLLTGANVENNYWTIKSFLQLLPQDTVIVRGSLTKFDEMVLKILADTDFDSKSHFTPIDDVVDDLNFEFEIDYLVVFYDQHGFDAKTMRSLSARAAEKGISTLFICYGETSLKEDADRSKYCCADMRNASEKFPSIIDSDWLYCPWCGEEIEDLDVEEDNEQEEGYSFIDVVKKELIPLFNRFKEQGPLNHDYTTIRYNSLDPRVRNGEEFQDMKERIEQGLGLPSNKFLGLNTYMGSYFSPGSGPMIQDDLDVNVVTAPKSNLKVYTTLLPGPGDMRIIHKDPEALTYVRGYPFATESIDVEDHILPMALSYNIKNYNDPETVFELETPSGQRFQFNDYMVFYPTNMEYKVKRVLKK